MTTWRKQLYEMTDDMGELVSRVKQATTEAKEKDEHARSPSNEG